VNPLMTMLEPVARAAMNVQQRELSRGTIQV
jgi:hypothetical protein